MNLFFSFIWHLLTRFAKTFGCIFFIAGLGVAAWLYGQKTPIIDSVRYQQSDLLANRLKGLQSSYTDTQQHVIKCKGAASFPTEYAAAAFTPTFPSHYASAKDFQDLQAQLAQASSAKDAMKRFVTDHFENLLNAIQQKLLAHAADLSQAPAPAPPVTLSPDYGLFDRQLNSSEIDSRQVTLDDAKQFLGVLESSAENPENKKALDDSMADLDAFEKLFPAQGGQVAPTEPTPSATSPSEPLNAEKGAARKPGTKITTSTPETVQMVIRVVRMLESSPRSIRPVRTVNQSVAASISATPRG